MPIDPQSTNFRYTLTMILISKKMQLLIIIGLLLIPSACAGSNADQGATDDLGPSSGVPAAILAAQRLIAEKHSIPDKEVQVSEYQAYNWSNDCLEFPVVGEECIAESIPGYVGRANTQESQYEFRTDATGEQVRLIPSAVDLARQNLAQLTGISQDKIQFVGFEAVDWADNCLETTREGVTCSTEITPGYFISMKASEQLYEYHTDQTGSVILLVNSP